MRQECGEDHGLELGAAIGARLKVQQMAARVMLRDELRCSVTST